LIKNRSKGVGIALYYWAICYSDCDLMSSL